MMVILEKIKRIERYYIFVNEFFLVFLFMLFVACSEFSRIAAIVGVRLGLLVHGRSSALGDHRGRRVLHILIAHHIRCEFGLSLLKARSSIAIQSVNLDYIK